MKHKSPFVIFCGALLLYVVAATEILRDKSATDNLLASIGGFLMAVFMLLYDKER